MLFYFFLSALSFPPIAVFFLFLFFVFLFLSPIFLSNIHGFFSFFQSRFLVTTKASRGFGREKFTKKTKKNTKIATDPPIFPINLFSGEENVWKCGCKHALIYKIPTNLEWKKNLGHIFFYSSICSLCSFSISSQFPHKALQTDFIVSGRGAVKER